MAVVAARRLALLMAMLVASTRSFATLLRINVEIDAVNVTHGIQHAQLVLRGPGEIATVNLIDEAAIPSGLYMHGVKLCAQWH